MTQEINYHTNKDILYINLDGRVDATNASSVEEKIQAIRKENTGLHTVLDLEKLVYISSAGLRILLRLRKEDSELSLINVSTEVYEILDMTGFTEMIDVQKAYRHLSVEGCEVIGKGANGAVYRYDPETIIKVYFNNDALPDIKRERELARKALVLGINTAIPYDVVRIGDKYGTVMELLAATSISKMIKKDPEHLEEPLKYFVDMLKQIHGTEIKPGEVPNMKELALKWARFDMDYLPEDIGKKLYQIVENVPDQDTLMHGDYHTNNVMVRDEEALLIDMDTLCMGHPIFELGSMFNAFEGFSVIDHEVVHNFLGFPYEVSVKFWRKSLSMYLGTEDESVIDDVENKAKIVGYMRLLRRSINRKTDDREALIEYYTNELIRLIPLTKELTF